MRTFHAPRRQPRLNSNRRLWGGAGMLAPAFAAAMALLFAAPVAMAQNNNQDNSWGEPESGEWEYEADEGLHHEEWYDPTDWWDQERGVSYERDWWDYDYDDYDYGYNDYGNDDWYDNNDRWYNGDTWYGADVGYGYNGLGYDDYGYGYDYDQGDGWEYSYYTDDWADESGFDDWYDRD